MAATCEYCGERTTGIGNVHPECKATRRRDARDAAAQLCHEIATRRGETLLPDATKHTLWRLNGCGTSLYGRSDEDPRSGTHLATKWFTLFRLPFWPLGRYRVLDTGGGHVFVGRAPRRPADWYLPVAIWGGIWLLLKVAG